MQNAPFADAAEEGSSVGTGSPAGALRAAHDAPSENFPSPDACASGFLSCSLTSSTG